MEHLLRAARGEYAKLEKPMTETEIGGWHEAGNIELHIEELVLHGFEPGDRHRIGEAIERELARLFAEQGTPPSLAQGARGCATRWWVIRDGAGLHSAKLSVRRWRGRSMED